MDVARHFVSPLVLRSLVDRLSSYRPPPVKAAPEPSKRTGKYAVDPAPQSAIPVAEEEEDDDTPTATVTEDLVVKLLACLMVHPQQGQRARLVLRDEVPETVYMALHQAGSVPADVKGDAATALPPLPHRDTDHKLYPKKGNAGAGAAGAEPARATGGAKTPESLGVPISISVAPAEEETAPVTMKNVESVEELGGEREGALGKSTSEASRSPSTKREGSFKRSVVNALKSQRASESRLPTTASSVASGRDNGEGGGDTSSVKKGLWQRASVSWAASSLNPANAGPDVRGASLSPKIDVLNEERPLTSPVSHPPSPTPSDSSRTRTLSMRKLATRLSPRPVSEVSPSTLPADDGGDGGGSTKGGKSVMGWGTSSVGSTSPRPSTSPKLAWSPKAADGRRGF